MITLKCALNRQVTTIWTLWGSDVKQGKKVWIKVSNANELAH